jgi:hypothetical protein
VFAYLDKLFAPHTIDRFTTMMENTQRPRFNSSWRDPHYEDIDSLHLPNFKWTADNSYCNLPRSALSALADKLQQSGATGTIVAPRSANKPWYARLLLNTADELITYPPTRNPFFPGRLFTRKGLGV